MVKSVPPLATTRPAYMTFIVSKTQIKMICLHQTSVLSVLILLERKKQRQEMAQIRKETGRLTLLPPLATAEAAYTFLTVSIH